MATEKIDPIIFSISETSFIVQCPAMTNPHLTVVQQRDVGGDERVDGEGHVAVSVTNLGEGQEDGDGVAEVALLTNGEDLPPQLRPEPAVNLIRHFNGSFVVGVQRERDDRQENVERRSVGKIVVGVVGDFVDVFEPVDERRRKRRQPLHRARTGLEGVVQSQEKDAPQVEDN